MAAALSISMLGLGGAGARFIYLFLTADDHVLPLRMGEALRPVTGARRTSVSMRAAIASTVVLRLPPAAARRSAGSDSRTGRRRLGSRPQWEAPRRRSAAGA